MQFSLNSGDMPKEKSGSFVCNKQSYRVYKTERQESMEIIKTEERIDIVAARKLEDSLNQKVEAMDTDLCIDMSDTKYICSVGLRCLLSAAKTMNKKNKKLIIKSVTPQVKEIFDVTGFSDIFNFED